ncbi:hypothetical protein ATCC90586_002424 [Pythium insidiosum]|nr:hypothetical protein ATCC90586_002424 [Pythium insidiosum]
MKLLAVLSSLAAIAASSLVAAYTNPLTIQHYKFYDSKTGKYVGVRGVDYYPRPNAGELDVNNFDFFTDDHADIWGPDVEQLAALGANAVRLYAVDPTKSHDKFMCALRSRGMYALVDLGANCENCSITKDKYPSCYPAELKTRGEQIITAFAKYDNLMAFSAGNEVNHFAKVASDNAPCQKKFIRDMRAFLGQCKTLRDVPVGVVLADKDREDNAVYYNCRTDPSDKYENAEWYGLNVYLHCDGKTTDPTTVGAGFQKLTKDFASYKMNIPVMLTEFGCLNPSFPTIDGYDAQRNWVQAAWLHSKALREQFNGGFVFEYSTENANSKADSPWPFTKYGAQNYGLGYYAPKDCDHQATKCVYKRMPNFENLAKYYNSTNYEDEPLMTAFKPSADKTAFPACPTGFAKLKDSTWSADSIDSLACPASYQAYTCPGQTASGNMAASKNTSSSTSSRAGEESGVAPSPNTNGNNAPAATNKPAGSSKSSAVVHENNVAFIALASLALAAFA